MGDIFKIGAVNGTVMGVVTLTDVELILKITLLLVTILWTVGKAVNEWERWLKRRKRKN